MVQDGSKPARPKLNPYTKALRRERIFSRRREGWDYSDIAREEGVSPQRVRQIVSDALKRQPLDEIPDHALLQLFRLEAAHAVAAEAVARGDLKAIGPYINVLERMDRYRKTGARKEVYDDAARERLFAKLNRVATRIRAEEARKAKKAATAAAPDPGQAPANGPESDLSL